MHINHWLLCSLNIVQAAARDGGEQGRLQSVDIPVVKVVLAQTSLEIVVVPGLRLNLKFMGTFESLADHGSLRTSL